MMDFSGFMHKLAKATESDTHNQVYVYREVLTAVYRQGFEDGQMAEHKDRSVAEQIQMLQEKNRD